jgi:hypothetical protein
LPYFALETTLVYLNCTSVDVFYVILKLKLRHNKNISVLCI